MSGSDTVTRTEMQEWLVKNNWKPQGDVGWHRDDIDLKLHLNRQSLKAYYKCPFQRCWKYIGRCSLKEIYLRRDGGLQGVEFLR
jgi:hypothetical protein